MSSVRLDAALYYIGKYGRYQIIQSVSITIIGTLFPAWHMMGLIFSVDRPHGFNCTQRSTTGVILNSSLSVRTDGYNRSFSDISEMENGECTDHSDIMRNGSAIHVPCTDWQYDTLYSESTIVTDLDLVCDRRIFAETAQSIFLFGMLTGSVVFGYLSDTFGRKVVLLGACLANGVLGIVVAFVWSYAGIVTLWFLVGMSAQGYNQVQFVMVMEMFPSDCRTLAGSINNLLWGAGIVTLAPIAYALRNWRDMQLAISVPCFIAIPLWFVCDDSVRWLLSKGRDEEVLRILKKMARWNKVTPPPGGFALYQNDVDPLHSNDDSKNDYMDNSNQSDSLPVSKGCSLVDVVKSRRLLLNLFIVFFLWFVGISTYYGASLNASYLAGNKYENFLFLGLAELPGYIIIHFTMTWWGRRPCVGLFFLVAGLASITSACIPQRTDDGTDLTVAILVSAMLVKCCIVCAYSINLICCTEILPTPIRNIGFGMGAVCGSVGAAVSPFVMYLDEFASWLPLTIFGSLCVISSLLVPLLPETKDKHLPETIQDAENIGKLLPMKTRITDENKEAPNETDYEKVEEDEV